MENIFLDCLKRHAVLDEKVVIGVSTGIDSMVLLHLVQKVYPPSQIIVAHVNHQKRAQSEEEEQFIRRFCQEQGLNLEVTHLEEQRKNANFQDMARKFRLQFFQTVMNKHHADVLLLAHHLDDDVETFFMRLLRGSSLRSLVGMQEKTNLEIGCVIRPLLSISKQEIREYAESNHLFYYEDESNHQNLYTRNRIRNKIIPLIKKENPLFLEQFVLFKKETVEIADWLDEVRDGWLDAYIRKSENKIAFSKIAFLKNKSLIQIEILFAILKRFHLSKSAVQELIGLIANKDPNIKIKFTGFIFLKEYDQIQFLYDEKEKTSFSVLLTGIGEYPIDEKRKIVVRKNNHKNSANPSNIWYNSDKLPITARCRHEGDKMHFDYGTKKVKRILIDRKIPLSVREQVIVLEKDEEIIALLGMVVSSKYKAQENSDILIELKEI
ncbi:MAG: tRNA lysidine(34) synthetase TilS [Bacilli bacterium]|nr:tRNA lysidine(34) synthetase TilS [Bacilli bacterium]